VLEALQAIPYEGAPPAEQSVRDPRVLIGIASLQEKSRIRSEPVVASIPGGEAFVHPLDVMLVGKKSLEEIIHLEVRHLIPFDMDAVLWGCEMFEAPAGERRRDGLLFAIKKETVNSYVSRLSRGKIEVDDVQAAPLALLNFVRYDQQLTGPTLIIDVGAAGTNIVGVHRDRYWVRSIPFGGNMITRSIAHEFGLSFEKAEAVKLNIGRSKHARKILEAILPALRGYVGELHNALHQIRTQARKLTFDRAFLFGSASRVIGLQKMISEEIQGTVVTPTEFSRIQLGKGVDEEQVRQNLPAIAVAAGLAIQGTGHSSAKIVLAVEGAARRKTIAKKKPYAAAIAAMLLLLLASMLSFGYYRLANLRRVFARVDEVSTILRARRDRLKQLGRQSDAERDLEALYQVGRDRSLCLLGLSEVMRLIPKNPAVDVQKRLWLVDFDLDQEKAAPLAYQARVTVVCARGGRDLQETIGFVKKTFVSQLQGATLFHDVTVLDSYDTVGIGLGRKAENPEDARYYLVRIGMIVSREPPEEPAEPDKKGP